jgi:hypothetical protein
VILTGETGVIGENSNPPAILSNTNITCSGRVSKKGLRRKRPATNSLCHATTSEDKISLHYIVINIYIFHITPHRKHTVLPLERLAGKCNKENYCVKPVEHRNTLYG